MINPKELRIGSWVHNGCGYVQIDAEDILCIDQGQSITTCSTDRSQPIPLTPEILEKAGFALIYKSDGRIKYSAENTGHEEFGISQWLKGSRKWVARFYAQDNIPCEHVHQLQNLFFSLTGEDLVINL